MITAKKLVDYAKSLLAKKAAYWYGTFGQTASTSLYNSKKGQYPSHYGSDRTSGYKADIAAGKTVLDCVGLFKAAVWTNCGEHAPKYATGGCPDQSANGMFSWAKSKGMKNGKMSTFPDVPGLFLHMDGHTGVSIGGGYAIEAKGFANDVVQTKIAGRGWTGWTYLPFIDYAVSGSAPPEQPATFGSRPLQKGDEGDDVVQLQSFLIDQGYSCGNHKNGGADGDFGNDTKKAVLAWQYDNGLPETGVIDGDDFVVIDKIMNPEPDEPEQETEPGPATTMKVTVTSGNTVNVRTAPTTEASKRGVAHLGEAFDYLGETAENGWHKILFGDSPGWITNLYTTLAGEVIIPAPPAPPIIDKPNAVIVDISQHNGLNGNKNDWAKVAKSVDLLIIRCGVTRTETAPIGIGIDAEFAYAAKKCQEYGIPFGVYFYNKFPSSIKGDAKITEAKKEAKKCWETASPYNPLFYCCDVEEGMLTVNSIKAFAEELRRLGAKKVGMYIGHNYYPTYKDAVKAFDFIWIPRYGKNDGTYNPKYAPAYPCAIHQYTSVYDGRKLGFADNTVDMNRLTGEKQFGWFLER